VYIYKEANSNDVFNLFQVWRFDLNTNILKSITIYSNGTESYQRFDKNLKNKLFELNIKVNEFSKAYKKFIYQAYPSPVNPSPVDPSPVDTGNNGFLSTILIIGLVIVVCLLGGFLFFKYRYQIRRNGEALISDNL